ncbi:MAG: efflux RND transporter permease subunit [Eubacterium sp.]|nr:efflux RND transporter permease subunit [Eubacterium sp.]
MISKYSVKRPYTVFVAVVAVLVIGVVALMRMTADLLPNMNLPYVLIITTDMGASPETVEKEVTAPIEAGMATTSNLKNIQSTSNNSYSTVILEYEQSANMDATLIEIQQSLDQIKGSFPDSVGTPIVMQLDPDMLPVMVAGVNVEEMDSIELTDYVNTDIKPALESIEGVASVSVSGGIEETVNVTMNQDKIDKLNDKIMAEIDEQFQEAKDKLADSKADIESGQDAVDSGKTTLADTIGEKKSELQTTQIELYQTGEELNEQLTTYQESYDSLGTTIETMNTTYDGAVTIAESIASLESVISLYDQGLLDDNTFAASAGMDIATAKAQKATLEAQLEAINTQLKENSSSLAEYNITVETYEDLPTAVAALEETRVQLATGIESIEGGIEEVETGKTTAKEAMEILEKNGIEQSITMAETSSTLSQGLAQIESAEDTIDSTIKTTKESADLNTILSLDTLNNLLVAQNFDMPAGYAKGPEGQYLVKVGDSIDAVENLGDTVLIDLNMDSVGLIKLSDVADIEKIDDSESVYARLNGEPGMLVSFEKQTGYSTGDVTDSILNKFDSLEKSEEENIHFAVLMNQGVYIDMIIKSILQNMILGAALAVLVLIVFLRDIRPTIIIACAIPLSVIFAVVLMYFTNITLNIISMSGLTLGIGMLVDNSIVVIENIYRLRREGESIKKAAVYGASQVAGAITASTLTTMCVFLPIVFTDGLTRQLFVDMGLTIAFTLSASLLVALTLVPAMAQGLLKKTKETEKKEESRFMRGYGKFLMGAMKFKPLVFLIMILLMGASIALAMSRGTEFMPQMQSDQLTVTLSVPEEETRTFEEMTSYSDQLTENLMGISEIETIGSMIGNGSTMGALSGGSDNSVTMYILLDENIKVSTDDITSKIEKASEDINCDVTVSAEIMDMQAMTGSGVSVMIKGRKMETLQKLAADVAGVLEATEGISDVDDGLSDTTKTLKITVDKKKAADYGMTVAQVYSLVASKLASTNSTTAIETDVKDYDVFLMTDEQSDITIDDLKEITFEYTDKSKTEEDDDEDDGEDDEEDDEEEDVTEDIPITRIASFTEGEELSVVRRDSQSRYISVSGEIAEGYNVGIVGSDIERSLNKVGVPEGYTVTLQGENETINDAMEQVMLMMLLAVILIYLIMVAQFQSLKSPFIIMFTIPLAFTGGFFALFLTGKAVSVIAMIGFVMLAGIIVNNGIVLVDYVNQLRRQGMSKKDAIIESAKTRLRPVLMTAITTIISMSTMALGMGKGVEMSQPMAIVVVGGLIYGTILTLVLVPCLYDAFNKEKDMTEEEI